MAIYNSNRQRQLNIGISSYTEEQLVLDVTGSANISGNIAIGRSLYDIYNSSGESGNVLTSTIDGVVWKKAGIGIGTAIDTETLLGVGITAVNFFGTQVQVGIATNLSVANLEIGGIFPIGDYGDLSPLYVDAFGIIISESFDCLTEPEKFLNSVDLGVL